MNYLFFILIAVLSACVIGFYCNYEGVFDLKVKCLPQKKVSDEKFKPFSKNISIIILLAVMILSFFIELSLHKNSQTIGFLKLFVLLIIVISAGIIDFKRKIIPNLLVLFGLLFWVAITVYEFSNSTNFKDIVISELIGFAVGFVLLALVSFLTKGAMGFGDVKLFGIIGLVSGAFCTYSTLLVSLIISVIISVIGMLCKKIGRKDAIPFGPCIALGYIIVLFLKSY